jgi:hypothetical protein
MTRFDINEIPRPDQWFEDLDEAIGRSVESPAFRCRAEREDQWHHLPCLGEKPGIGGMVEQVEPDLYEIGTQRCSCPDPAFVDD